MVASRGYMTHLPVEKPPCRILLVFSSLTSAFSKFCGGNRGTKNDVDTVVSYNQRGI